MTIKWEKIYQMHTALQVNFEKQKEFCKLFGFNQCAYYSRPYSLEKFLNSNQGYNAGSKFDSPAYLDDWMDHAEFFRNKVLDLRVMAGQSYLDPETNYKRLKEVIEPLGLRGVVYKSKSVSWYYPNSALVTLAMSKEAFKHYQKQINEYGEVYKTI